MCAHILLVHVWAKMGKCETFKKRRLKVVLIVYIYLWAVLRMTSVRKKVAVVSVECIKGELSHAHEHHQEICRQHDYWWSYYSRSWKAIIENGNWSVIFSPKHNNNWCKQAWSTTESLLESCVSPLAKCKISHSLFLPSTHLNVSNVNWCSKNYY